MRRIMWSVVMTGVMLAAVGLSDPEQAQAGPGFFSLSVGTPSYTGYYGAGYPGPGYGGYPGPNYAGYAGVAPVVSQPYMYAGLPFGGGPSYPGLQYGAYTPGGFYPHASYGHHGYGHGHYRW
ncbi:MAG TPA: hypothetical protein VGG64_25140 [Pirellulales bacterium]|jgi:hypothetical protein